MKNRLVSSLRCSYRMLAKIITFILPYFKDFKFILVSNLFYSSDYGFLQLYIIATSGKRGVSLFC